MTVDIFHIICRAPVAHTWFFQSDDELECLASHNQTRLLFVHLGSWLASDLAGLMWSGIVGVDRELQAGLAAWPRLRSAVNYDPV